MISRNVIPTINKGTHLHGAAPLWALVAQQGLGLCRTKVPLPRARSVSNGIRNTTKHVTTIRRLQK